MKEKEKRKEDYMCDNVGYVEPYISDTADKAFDAGWHAAMQYLSTIPFNKILDEITNEVNND